MVPYWELLRLYFHAVSSWGSATEDTKLKLFSMTVDPGTYMDAPRKDPGKLHT